MRDAVYRVASAHRARVTPFDPAFIEGLRKEFLLLMKNVKVVKDPKQAEAWRQAMAKWRERFDDLINKRLRSAIGDMPIQHPHVSRDEATKWQRYVGSETWGLVTVALNVPFTLDPNFSVETSFHRYQRDLKKWEGQARRGARKAWKALKEFALWYRHTTQAGDPTIDIPAEEQARIEGFQVLVKGFTNSDYDNEDLERFKIGLRLYKSRAAKVLPLLLRKQLPLVLDFKAGIDAGGEYHQGKFISINAHASKKNPGHIAHYLAHEMGHHIHRTHLSGEAQKFWWAAITGNYGKLDLNAVLRKYGSQKSFFDSALIKKQDPILWLQIGGAFESYEHVFAPRTGKMLFQMDDVREYLANGGQAVWSVHGKPITAYAHKNPEEAFCEALGMLVGYGPRTVLAEVRSWLKTILPNIKIASVSRVASRHLARDPHLAYYGLDGLLEGKPTTLYHGTTASFRRFDLSKSRDELVNRFYGKGIFLTPKKTVAGEYADANRNIGFPVEVLDDLNPKASAFAKALYRGEREAWDEFAVLQPDGGVRVDEKQVGGVDPNDLQDLVDYVIGSKTKPVGGSGPNMFFSQATGMPGYVYDLLDTLGIESLKYRPKVYTVSVKVSNCLVTDSKAEAKRARSKGYDSVVYYGPDAVGNVPEVAVYDARAVTVRRVEAW